MGRRADLPSGAGKDGYVHRNQQWLFGEIPVLDDSDCLYKAVPWMPDDMEVLQIRRRVLLGWCRV